MRATIFTLLAALSGCTAPSESTSAALVNDERVDELAVELGAAPPAYTEVGPELVLDRRADGAEIRGHALAALIETDEEPVYEIHVTGQREPALEGAHAVAAAFVDGGIVTIGADHVLRAHREGRVSELDAEALGPLSVAGSEVAYVRGAMPFYELAIADVAAGTARARTTDMAPVWSPALSPDGDVVFVSGASGAPRLYRLSAAGALEALPETAFFPSSLRAPRFDGSVLSFEDETGQPHTLDVRAEAP